METKFRGLGKLSAWLRGRRKGLVVVELAFNIHSLDGFDWNYMVCQYILLCTPYRIRVKHCL